jgi:hypothetical protein
MNDVLASRPGSTEYPPHLADYIAKVPAGSLLDVLLAQNAELQVVAGGLDDAAALVRHAPYTWSIKQVVGHLNDAERVFGYRAMRLARGDATPLPGFDENAYMAATDFDARPLNALLEEFDLQRRAHVLMFTGLEREAWLRQGLISDHPMTMRAVACVMAGHAEHHLRILRKRLGR